MLFCIYDLYLNKDGGRGKDHAVPPYEERSRLLPTVGFSAGFQSSSAPTDTEEVAT